jgi:hypothetical protein
MYISYCLNIAKQQFYTFKNSDHMGHIIMYVITNNSGGRVASICRSGNHTHCHITEHYSPTFHHCDNHRLQSVHFLVFINFVSLRKTRDWSHVFVEMLLTDLLIMYSRLHYVRRNKLQYFAETCTYHSF